MKPLTVEPFHVEVVSEEPWPPIAASTGAGVARLLQTALERGGAAECEATISGHIWIADQWQAEIQVGSGAGGVRHAEAAAFDQGHHLLYRLAEFAAKHLGRELPEAAIRAFDDLRTASPGAMLAYWAGLGADASDEQRRAWMRAFELDPQLIAARLALAGWVMDHGGAPAAAATLTQGVSVNDAYAASELGLALWAAGADTAAVEMLQAAVRANPKDALAGAGLAALIARSAMNNSLGEMGLSIENQHQALDEALLLATQATQLASDDYRCWAALGDVYRALSDFSQSGFYYGFALRLEPEAPTVLKDAGAVWLLARQPQKALPLIERALKAAPADGEIYGNLAFAHDLSGDTAAALEAARQASALNPENARLRILHGDLAQKAGKREEALEAWARASELDPGMMINPEGGNIGLPEPATTE